MSRFNIIAARCKNGGIGFKNKLPWRIPEELQYFKQMTSFNENLKQNVVIMGRNTWESLGKKPLPNRHNLIVSKDYLPSFDCALREAEKFDSKIWVIGGAKLYEEAVEHPLLDKLYLTKINKNYECDTVFPSFNAKLIDKSHIQEKDWQVEIYQKQKNGEIQYLELLEELMKYGNTRQTRNSEVRSLFGRTLKFDLQNNTFPLLTTKKMFMKGITQELIMFLNGITNSKFLEYDNINIWKGNTSKEFLASRNLDYEEGEMGPMYGYQWRKWNDHFDQLEDVLETISKDPTSRRLLFTTYNPTDVPKSVLAPCHGLISQLYIENGGISLQTYQRSADMFLGVPFNIASYGLLLHTFINVINTRYNKNYYAKDLIINFGDCHVYRDHYPAVYEQLLRVPYKFPKIKFNENLNNLEDLLAQKFEIYDYKYHKLIRANMIV